MTIASKPFKQQANIWILVNGELYVLNFAISIREFIEYLNLNTSELIIEYNQKIIPKTLLTSTFIKNFDRFELVTIVGGG